MRARRSRNPDTNLARVTNYRKEVCGGAAIYGNNIKVTVGHFTLI